MSRFRLPNTGFMGAVWMTAAVLVLLYLMSGFRIIKPGEQALVVRFGKKIDVPLLPGTHYTFPYPVDRVFIYKPSEVKSILVGATSFFPRPQGVQAASFQGTNVGTEFLAGDENIVELELNVQYQISDPFRYLFHAVNADRLVVLACDTALTVEMAQTKVDEILTSGRQLLLTEVKAKAQEMLDTMQGGVTLIALNLSKATPPMRVADAFKDVASALEDRDRLINDANGQYNQIVSEARGQANSMLQESLADSNGAVKRAQGEADRFEKTLYELKQSSHGDLAVLRIYLENMEEIMPRFKKYILDTAGKRP